MSLNLSEKLQTRSDGNMNEKRCKGMPMRVQYG